MEPVYWLIALAVFLVLEIITLGLTTIWFAGGCLVAFIGSICGIPIVFQFLLFLVVSLILLLFTRPVVEKHFNHNRSKTNLDGLIGNDAKVIEEIDNFHQKGKIILNGMEWTARSENPNRTIPKDAKVIIKQIEGAHAVVAQSE